MSVQQIDTEHLLLFLRSSKNAIADQRGSDWYWSINGVEYPEAQALKLAEYCMITGQALTPLATIEAALNLARRVQAAEKGIANHNLMITELKREIDTLLRRSHGHWWRRHG